MDKNELKNSLSIEQVSSLVAELGGEPKMANGYFISRTICHNKIDENASHKLYYYDNTKLFQCYTNCGSFDIFELVLKVREKEGIQWSLPKSIRYVASYFGYNIENDFEEDFKTLDDWQILNNYRSIDLEDKQQIVELKKIDKKVLDYLPHPRIIMWEKEGISNKVIQESGICYDPVNESIIIPHFDIEGNLIGIRQRTLVQEEEESGKYKPAILNGIMYNHPLGYNLYNLNNSKENIKVLKKAIVFESEKSTLQFRTYFENDISVACCGSNLISYQVNLLLSLGVEEIIIAFDRQYQKIGDEEFKKWTKKLQALNDKYKNYCTISFVFDKGYTLKYKASPTDQGAETFLKLFNERIFL